MSSESATTHEPDDRQLSRELFDLIRGYIGTELLFVAATLRLADHLADGVRSSVDLAELTETNPAALQRVLLGLVSLGICTHDEDMAFGLTPMGRLLHSDHPSGYQDFAIYHHDLQRWAVGELLYSVRTGEVGIERAVGSSLFDYLAQHPEHAARFDRAMGTAARETADALLSTYNFTGAATVIDIGGGLGIVLAAILARYPTMHGMLFDLPQVIERSAGYLRNRGLADRSQTFAGDFFTSVPSGGDIYLLSRILHDWDDADCRRILANIHAAMTAGSRLLILERILPERVGRGEPAVFADLLMLTVTGGQERTEAGYRRLLADAGFSRTQIIPLDSPFSVIEALR